MAFGKRRVCGAFASLVYGLRFVFWWGEVAGVVVATEGARLTPSMWISICVRSIL